MKIGKFILLSLIILALFSIFIFLILLLLNNSPLTFIDTPVIDIFYIKNNKIDLVNICIALSTTISAAGLCYFSYLTYRNQKSQEFETLYRILLNEHNKLLSQKNFATEIHEINLSIFNIYRKSVFEEPEKYDKYLEIQKILNNNENIRKTSSSKKERGRLTPEELDKINKNLEEIRNFYYILSEKDKEENNYTDINYIKNKINKIYSNLGYFEEHLKHIINKNPIIRPYLIILFRILKYIYRSNKISNAEKKEYSGLVRSLINEDILFIILLNSKGWESKKNNDQSYSFLLKKMEFFEHFNVPDFVQNNFANESNDNIKKGFVDYLTQGQAIDKAAFGKNSFI